MKHKKPALIAAGAVTLFGSTALALQPYIPREELRPAAAQVQTVEDTEETYLQPTPVPEGVKTAEPVVTEAPAPAVQPVTTEAPAPTQPVKVEHGENMQTYINSIATSKNKMALQQSVTMGSHVLLYRSDYKAIIDEAARYLNEKYKDHLVIPHHAAANEIVQVVYLKYAS